MRIGFLCLSIILLAFGFTSLLGFIEPYSLYGKIMGAFVRPSTAFAIDQTSNILAQQDIYWYSSIDGNAYISLSAFSLASIILIALWIAVALKARLFCNTVCPVGTWLGVLAKFSIFKIKVDQSDCIKCGLCERSCKAECINSKEGKIDFSRCVLCFDCAQNCKKSAIVFGLNNTLSKIFKKKESGEKNTEKTAQKTTPQEFSKSRRKFGTALTALFTTLALGAKKDAEAADKNGKNCKGGNCKNYQTDADASPYGLHGERPDKRIGVPAGSQSIENFLEKCTGCQICTSACKSNILKPAMGEWGLGGLMQPYMDFTNGYCLYTCHSCTKACPTGAIKFLSGKQKRKVKIGTAKFKRSLCVVKTDGTDCAACAEHCPVQAIEMIPFNKSGKSALYIPYVHEDVCIGCGACEYICPVRPHRAIVVQALAVHKEANEWNDSMRVHKIPNEQKNSAQKNVENSDTKNSNPFPF